MEYIRQIIFHCQINCIFQCNDFKFLHVFIICSIHGIIKLQELFSAVKDHTEYTVFVLSVYF